MSSRNRAQTARRPSAAAVVTGTSIVCTSLRHIVPINQRHLLLDSNPSRTTGASEVNLQLGIGAYLLPRILLSFPSPPLPSIFPVLPFPLPKIHVLGRLGPLASPAMGDWGTCPLELGHVQKFGSFYLHNVLSSPILQ